MFLKAPSVSDKPKANRSQKGAFTNTLAPRIKKWKAPDEDADGASDSPGAAAEARKPKVCERFIPNRAIHSCTFAILALPLDLLTFARFRVVL